MPTRLQDPSNTLKSFKAGCQLFLPAQIGRVARLLLDYREYEYATVWPCRSSAVFAPSSTSSPNTSGWAAELDYLPWQNVKLALQYTLYTKFNGSSSNYDGAGRNASDNNTLYIFAWLAF